MDNLITKTFEKPFAEDTLLWRQVCNDWNTTDGVYGQIREVSVRFRFPKPTGGCWIGANLSEESSIEARITPMTDGLQVTEHLFAQLYYRGDNSRVYTDNCIFNQVACCTLDEEMGVTWDTEFEVTLSLTQKEALVIVNGQQVISAPLKEMSCEEGFFGIRSIGNTVLDVDWVRVTYLPGTEPKKENTGMIPTFYCEDFTEREIGARGEYWLEPLHSCNWEVAHFPEGNALATRGNVEYAPVHLHVFDRNTKLKAVFSTEGNSGGCGFLFRLGPDAMYLKLRADLEKKQWQLLEARLKGGEDILLDTADLRVEGKQEISVCLNEHELILEQDGKVILHSQDKIRNMGFGRPGFFSDGAVMKIYQVEYEFPSGGTPNPGVMEYSTPEPGCCSGSMEILPIGDGKAIGFSNSGNNFMFTDYGADCQLIENDPYQHLNPGGEYISITKLHSGKYLKVDIFTFMASQSDDLIHWEDLGYVVPQELQIDHVGRRVFLFHVNTIREIRLPDGKLRIFMPVLHRLYRNDQVKGASGNYTMVFYSDDGGKTWVQSKNDTQDVALDVGEPASKWGECKVVLCADGSLRLYMTRGRVGCVQYLTSRDNGETWTEFGVIPYMQCAGSSFCVDLDERTGYYYFVWVNNNAQFRNSLMWRSRVSVARSRDGMNWEYLCDADRFDERTAHWDQSPTFQIVDPSLAIYEDYLLISYGRGENELSGVVHSYHRAQRARVVRIPLATLKPKPWNAVSVSNMKYPERIEILELPERTQYGLAETVDLSGGRVRVVSLDGSETEMPMCKLFFRKEPILDTTGLKKITLYHSCGISCSFEIEVM